LAARIVMRSSLCNVSTRHKGRSSSCPYRLMSKSTSMKVSCRWLKGRYLRVRMLTIANIVTVR